MNLQKFQSWRLRGSRFLVVVIFAVALFTNPVLPSKNDAWGLAFECAGCLAIGACIVGRLWSAAHLSGQKNNRVVCEGPYSICRNPLYFFTMLGFIGVGLSLGSLILTAALAGAFLLTHLPIILREEKHLGSLFGDEYAAYCRRVPRLIPSIGTYASSPTVTFAAEPFLRAAGDAGTFLLAFPVVRVLVWCHANGHLPTYLNLW